MFTKIIEVDASQHARPIVDSSIVQPQFLSLNFPFGGSKENFCVTL